MSEFTADGGNHADGDEATGHNGHPLEVNPFDTPEVRERHRQRQQAEAAASATVVSGSYAAAVAVGLSPAGRACLSRLTAVNVADLAAEGVITGPHPTKGDVTAWHTQRGRTWNPPPANGVNSPTDVKVAAAGIDPKARCALADVVSAADDGQPWAAKVIDTARAENAYAALIGDRKQRPVSLTTAELFDRGAPLDAIKALPDETKLTRGQSARIVRAWDAEERLRAADQAHAIEAAKAAAAIEIPGRVNLATYTPPETAWLVDGLVPMNGSLGLFAERKAGKTTSVVELVRATLSGDNFLGRFATNLPADARVTLLDTEMTPAMLHHEYTKVSTPADQLDRIDLHPLRGRSRLLDLRDETTRARWRELIAPGSVVVVDCLYTVLAAAQVDESSAQVSDIIDGIKALAVECAAAGLVIVHHLGKDPGKGARGHSSIEGGVDPWRRSGSTARPPPTRHGCSRRPDGSTSMCPRRCSGAVMTSGSRSAPAPPAPTGPRRLRTRTTTSCGSSSTTTPASRSGRFWTCRPRRCTASHAIGCASRSNGSPVWATWSTRAPTRAPSGTPPTVTATRSLTLSRSLTAPIDDGAP